MEADAKQQREKRREYFRKYRIAHPEKYRTAQMRYWTKKAAEARETAQADLEKRLIQEDTATNGH